MAERMLALRTHSRVRGRADKLDEAGIPPSRLDRTSTNMLLRFVRGELPPAPHVLAAAHRGLVNPRLVASLVEAHRRGAPLGRHVDARIEDPLQVIGDPAFDLTGAAAADEIEALAGIARKLDIAVKATREGHMRLATIRHDDRAVGVASECGESVGEVFAAGWAKVRGRKRAEHEDWSVALPPLDMWQPVEGYISGALDALLAGSPGVARELLVSATSSFARCHRRVMEYKERTEAGASGVAQALHVVQVSCESLCADLAAAALAPAGLAVAALAAAAAGASAVAADGLAQRAVEHRVGLRRDWQLGQLLGDIGQAALSNFLSALLSGFLAKEFERLLASILRYHVPPELWLHVLGEGEERATEEVMKHFATWKKLSALCGAEAATLVSGTVDATLARYRSLRRKDAHVESFMETFEQDLLANGLAQLVVSALTGRVRRAA